MNKKLVSYFDDDDSVTLDFADGTQYKGHVLIGADGAYSTVRKLMYAKIKEVGKLPEEDEGALPYRTTCLVGQTTPQNPEEFPEMRTEDCTFYSVRGINEPYTVSSFRESSFFDQLESSLFAHIDTKRFRFLFNPLNRERSLLARKTRTCGWWSIT